MPHPSVLHPRENGGFERTEVQTNLDELMLLLGKLCAHTPPGVWVASTDMLLTCTGREGEVQLARASTVTPSCPSCSAEPLPLKTSEFESVVVFTVSCTPDYAAQHGVCKISDTVSMLLCV